MEINWIRVKDVVPVESEPVLLLWDDWGDVDDTGCTHGIIRTGFFISYQSNCSNPGFHTDEDIPESELNITHWAKVEPPFED